MDRHQYEDLTFKDLQAELRKYGLKPTNSRDGCMDLLMNHLEAGVADPAFITLPVDPAALRSGVHGSWCRIRVFPGICASVVSGARTKLGFA